MAFDLAGMFGTIPKRQLAIFGAVIGAMIVVGYVMLVVWPKQEEIGRLTAESRKLGTEVEEKRKIALQLPQIEREVQAMDLQLKEVLVRLPEEKEIPNLLTQVSTLGQQSGLDFSAFRPAKIEPRDFYSEVPINLRVEGTYHTLGTFFDRLSKMPRIVTVGEFKISPLVVKKPGDKTIAAEFGVVTYTYGGAPAKGAPAKAVKK
jgi:type IV pilus assembly protein PilO